MMLHVHTILISLLLNLPRFNDSGLPIVTKMARQLAEQGRRLVEGGEFSGGCTTLLQAILQDPPALLEEYEADLAMALDQFSRGLLESGKLSQVGTTCHDLSWRGCNLLSFLVIKRASFLLFLGSLAI